MLVLQVGGNANNGVKSGRFYGNWNNTSSNSNWNISGLHFFRFELNRALNSLSRRIK